MDKKKILIIDDDKTVEKVMKRSLSKYYEIGFCHDGKSGFETIKSYSPELVFLDIQLPIINGFDLLQKIREKYGKNIGVVLISSRCYIQDYQMAIEHGANYFLLKPFTVEKISDVVNSFFVNKLDFESFDHINTNFFTDESEFKSIQSSGVTYLKMWGTRGSVPVSGAEFSFYGGNTTCLEFRDKDNIVIFDAGTGIRALGDELMKGPIRDIHLIISHTHWDHILSFPFFAPAYSSEFNINIYGPKGFGSNIKDLFRGMLNPNFFPVKLEEMNANIQFHHLDSFRSIEVGNFEIEYTYASHPGATFCFLVKINGKKIGIATDNEFLVGQKVDPLKIKDRKEILAVYQNMIDLFKGADILIHEAQYTNEEYSQKVGWGHSSISNASLLMNLSSVKKWLVTHHAPDHSDKILHQKLALHQNILKYLETDCEVEMAFDGMKIDLASI